MDLKKFFRLEALKTANRFRPNKMKDIVKYPLFICCALFPFLVRAEKVGDVVRAGDKYMMLVREFDTPESNDVFQANLNIMMRDSRAINTLKKNLEGEKDPAKKKDISEKLKRLEEIFEKNDAAMRRVYAFSSSRQYKRTFLESYICTVLSKEELSDLRSADGSELDPMLISKKNKINLYRHRLVKGEEENRELQKLINFTVSRRAELEALRKKLASTIDASEQLKINESMAKTEQAIKDNDSILRDKYGIRGKVDYAIEVSKSRLYLYITPQEAAAAAKGKPSGK